MGVSVGLVKTVLANVLAVAGVCIPRTSKLSQLSQFFIHIMHACMHQTF